MDEIYHYEIVVKGHLDPRRTHWFDGMALTVRASGETLIAGPIPDQAALYGLLSRIRDLGLELVSVQRTLAQDA